MRLGNISKSTTFQPTQAERMVLMNISMREETQQPVTQEDATNVAKEWLETEQISRDNLSGALQQLIKNGFVEQQPDGTLTLTDAGREEAEQAQQEEDVINKQKDLAGGPSASSTPPAPGADMGLPPMGGGQEQGSQAPDLQLQSFSLIRDLSLYALLEKLKK